MNVGVSVMFCCIFGRFDLQGEMEIAVVFLLT